jgi:hypothetical protein
LARHDQNVLNVTLEYRSPRDSNRSKQDPNRLNIFDDISHGNQDYNDSELRVGKKISKEQLESLKEIDVVNYKYYTTANAYFDSLSKKIKEMYTVNELWYIYVFDQNLKNKLLTIK